MTLILNQLFYMNANWSLVLCLVNILFKKSALYIYLMYTDMGYFYKQASYFIYTKQLFNYVQAH